MSNINIYIIIIFCKAMELILHSQKATVQTEKKKRNLALILTLEVLNLHSMINWGQYEKC